MSVVAEPQAEQRTAINAPEPVRTIPVKPAENPIAKAIVETARSEAPHSVLEGLATKKTVLQRGNHQWYGKDNLEREQSKAFDVISQQQIDAYKQSLLERYGIDLSTVSINIARPGDTAFDEQEIKFKYFQHTDEPSFSELGDLLAQYEENPNAISIDNLRAVAKVKGIVLEGKMPGFANTSGDNQITFFAVQTEDAIPMAERYAAKAGRNKTFRSEKEAEEYLQGLGEEAFLHEVGHIIYGRLTGAKVAGWNNYVDGNQALKDSVVAIQKDKYDVEADIPVAEEAFADYFVNITGEGRITSRLGENPEIIQRVSQMLSGEIV